MFQKPHTYDFTALILRLGLAVIFFLDGCIQWDMVPPRGNQPLFAWGELFGGIALGLGFLTRLSAAGLGFILVAAVILVLGNQDLVPVQPLSPFTGAGVAQATGFAYLLNYALAMMCLAVVIQGGGQFALDSYLTGRAKKIATTLGWATLLTAALVPLQLRRDTRASAESKTRFAELQTYRHKRATPAAAESKDLLAELKSYRHQLIYETNRDGNWELYVCNADGSNPVNLTRTPDVDELYPRPSPDGSKICFVADEGQGDAKVRNIYYMNSDGTGRTKIATNGREPCWSPDGTQIAYMQGEFVKFTHTDFATKGLFIYDLRTRQTREHVNHDLEHAYTLNWSPDGRWFVATVYGNTSYGHGVAAIEANSDKVVDLKLQGCRPNISPDGKKLCWGHGNYELGVADLDLSGPTPTATNVHDVVESQDPDETYHVTWSPDMKYLAFSRGPKFEGKNLKRLLPASPGVEAPGWNVCVADATQQNRWVAITSDGKSCKQPNWVRVKGAAPN